MDTGMSPRSVYYHMSCSIRVADIGFRRGHFVQYGANEVKPPLSSFLFSDSETGPGERGDQHPAGVDALYEVRPQEWGSWGDQCDRVITQPTIVFSPLYVTNIFHSLHDVVVPLWHTLTNTGEHVNQHTGMLNTDILLLVADTTTKALRDEYESSIGRHLMKQLTRHPVMRMSDVTWS
eukprot:GFYU01030752.1.p1 GENE.GFYU01030752.1~~GFYU01030752.1.p1  ORF type:complete len:178 (+),score=14.82 GFYU01030752.1:2-535(+)